MSYVLPLGLTLFSYIGLLINFRKISQLIRADHLVKFRIVEVEKQSNKALVNSIINNGEELTNNIHNVSVLTLNTNINKKLDTLQKNKLIRAKKKQAKVLILIGLILLIFALTWLPVHMIQVWRILPREKFPFNDLIFMIKLISHTLSYSNSCIKPFIFLFNGSKLLLHLKSEFSYFRKKESIPLNDTYNSDEKDDDDDYSIIHIDYDATLEKVTSNNNNSLFKVTKSFSPCGSFSLMDSISITKSYDAFEMNQKEIFLNNSESNGKKTSTL